MASHMQRKFFTFEIEMAKWPCKTRTFEDSKKNSACEWGTSQQGKSGKLRMRCEMWLMLSFERYFVWKISFRKYFMFLLCLVIKESCIMLCKIKTSCCIMLATATNAFLSVKITVMFD
ncbi:hypothetical protein CEXT_100541 [Caerostris extrusa]|uniref:Uncharacterized protein n=1 Tax=Caerostris extrusa TaxID=172846 RepID=A0AAV4M8V7_CAEEX|nr:hypothetical protein CEXT_100541 [Caerostris extrusa]